RQRLFLVQTSEVERAVLRGESKIGVHRPERERFDDGNLEPIRGPERTRLVEGERSEEGHWGGEYGARAPLHQRHSNRRNAAPRSRPSDRKTRARPRKVWQGRRVSLRM